MTTPFVPSIAEPKDEFRGTPLEEFKGKLESYTAREIHFDAKNGQAARDSKSIDFDFSNLSVIRSREPYVLPIAKVSIPYSEKNDTRWAAWTKSIRQLVPAEMWSASPDPIGQIVVGRMQHWSFKGGATLRQALKDDAGADIYENGRQKWGPVDADTWQVVSIDGLASASKNVLDAIAEFAVGKDEATINQAVFQNPDWKGMVGHQGAVEATLSRSLLPGLILAGKIVLGADGLYAKGPNG